MNARALALALGTLAACKAPERFVRALDFTVWTYDGESSETGLASRVTAGGGIGSQGLLKTSGSGEGWGAGASLDMNMLLGPEVQSVRIVSDDRAYVDDRLREIEARAFPALPENVKDALPDPLGLKNPGVLGAATGLAEIAGVLLAIAGALEVVLRKMGKGGLVVPFTRMLVGKFVRKK